jgi:GDP-L-fucose synthase
MKTVMLTGGRGFLGRSLQPLLREKYNLLAPTSQDCNLMNYAEVNAYLKENPVDAIIHSAAFYGGIGINQTEPANIFFRNTVMASNLFEAAAHNQIKQVIPIGSACAYPGDKHGDLSESDFWAGPLHDSVEAYGFSKKLQHVAQRAYFKQYGIESNHLILTNMYGPHDDYSDYRSHVVAALIKRFSVAKVTGKEEVVCWGDGSPIREFIYVGDAAKLIVNSLELPHSLEPVNIGTGIGTSIRELTELIVEIVGYKGNVIWDTDKPNGVARKVLDTTRLNSLFPNSEFVELREGLTRTVEWFREHLLEEFIHGEN